MQTVACGKPIFLIQLILIKPKLKKKRWKRILLKYNTFLL